MVKIRQLIYHLTVMVSSETTAASFSGDSSRNTFLIITVEELEDC